MQAERQWRISHVPLTHSFNFSASASRPGSKILRLSPCQMGLGISMYSVEDMHQHLSAGRHLRVFRSKGSLTNLERTANEPLSFPIVALDGVKHGTGSHRTCRDWMFVPQVSLYQQERLLQQKIRFSVLSLGSFQYPHILQDGGQIRVICTKDSHTDSQCALEHTFGLLEHMVLGIQNPKFVQAAGKTWIERSNLFSLFDLSVNKIFCPVIWSFFKAGFPFSLGFFPTHVNFITPPARLSSHT